MTERRREAAVGASEHEWSKRYLCGLPGPWRPLLYLCSLGYKTAVAFRLWAFRCGLLRQTSLAGYVISVGNVTAGGTGKTPAAIMLARWAQGEGYRVGVLSRGYKGRYKGPWLEVSDGKSVREGPRAAGDEPYVMATKLPGVPVVVSKRRSRAGGFAIEKHGCDILVLDDGFQHLSLKRNLDLVLVDGAAGFANNELLPLGPLREPLSQLSRADVFVVTRCADADRAQGIVTYLKTRFPEKPVFTADHTPEVVVFPNAGRREDARWLAGRRVVAFAGIARPGELKCTLEGLGAEVRHFQGFPDHYSFREGEIKAVIAKKEEMGADCIITTEKDWVRLPSPVSDHVDMGYLGIKMTVASERSFFTMIRKRIEHFFDEGGHEESR